MKEWIETLYDFTKWVNEIIKNQMSKESVFGNSESQHNDAYDYKKFMDTKKHLSDFNIEQQGDIIADYFIYGRIELYNILKEFILDPKNKNLLPNSTEVWDWS